VKWANIYIGPIVQKIALRLERPTAMVVALVSFIVQLIKYRHKSINESCTSMLFMLCIATRQYKLGHDIKLHPHRVKLGLYRIGCVGSGLVLAKALT